jgi:NCS1 family nucleobase:cation symporter-1
LLTDYFWVRKSEINVDDLYRKQGLYTYCNGYNPVAVIALAAGVLPNIPGFLVQIKALDAAVVPPFFTELYHYAWFVGLALAGLVYVVLMKPQAKTLAPVEILPEQPEAAEVANAGD